MKPWATLVLRHIFWHQTPLSHMKNTVLYQLVGMFVCLFSQMSMLESIDVPLLPLHSAEAEHVDFDERVIHLVGHVKVVHEIGILCCDEGTLLLPQEKGGEDQVAVDTILLNGHVDIQFTDGSRLISNEAVIDCLKHEGTFFSEPPEKVLYTGFASGEHRKVPVRASGRALKANIVKTPAGYALASLKGEGTVNIEYLTASPNKQDSGRSSDIPSASSETSPQSDSTPASSQESDLSDLHIPLSEGAEP